VTAQSPFPYLELSEWAISILGRREASSRLSTFLKISRKCPGEYQPGAENDTRDKISPHELSLVNVRPAPGLLGHTIASLLKNDSKFLGTAARNHLGRPKDFP